MRENRKVLCGFIAWLVAMCFFFGCLALPGLSEKISSVGNTNILVYGMTLVLFCLVFVIGMGLSSLGESKETCLLENTKIKKCFFALLMISQIPFWLICVARETEQLGSVSAKYGWHTQPLIFGAVLFVLELIMFGWIYGNITIKSQNNEWIVWIAYIVLTVLILYSMYTPNIFGRGEQSDSYHGHAYFNSVYNIYQGMPYTHNVTSIYGHYALFFKTPMELVHGDFKAFVMMIAIICAVAYFCAFMVLQILVQSPLLRIIGAVAMAFPVLGMRGGYYWQVWPHRVIFPMILLLYGAIILKKNIRGFWSAAIGYFICLLAVLWNTETGLFLTVSWAAMYVSRYFSRNRFKIQSFLRMIILNCVGMVFSVFGAYGVVNAYNIMKHSPANSLEDFLVPLLSGNYMTGVLHLDMPLYPCAYMAVMTLFLVGIAFGLSGWFYNEKSGNWKKDLIFLLSVGALGCLVYYINRPAYHNLDCIALPAVILSAYIGQRGLNFIRQNEWIVCEKLSFSHLMCAGVGIICAASVIAMSTGTALQFSQNSKIKENFHNMEEFDELAAEVAEIVPENTPAFGINIPEIYSLLHRRTECFTMDFSDMMVRRDSLKELKDQLENSDMPGAFTGKSSLEIWERNDPDTYQWFVDNYELKETITFQQEEFQYYERK